MAASFTSTFTPPSECFTPVLQTYLLGSDDIVLRLSMQAPECQTITTFVDSCYPTASDHAMISPSGWTVASQTTIDGTETHITFCPGSFAHWSLASFSTDPALLCLASLTHGSIAIQLNDLYAACQDTALVETFIWGPGTSLAPWLLAEPGGHSTYTINRDSITMYFSATPIIAYQTPEDSSTSSSGISTQTTAAPAGKLPTSTLAHTTADYPPGGSADNPTEASSPASISMGAKVGIGVGVSIAGIALIALLFWLRRRHQKGKKGALDQPGSEGLDLNDGQYTGKAELPAIETKKTTQFGGLTDERLGDGLLYTPDFVRQPPGRDDINAAYASGLEVNESRFRTHTGSIPDKPELENQPPRNELHGNPRAELPGSGWYREPPEARTLISTGTVVEPIVEDSSGQNPKPESSGALRERTATTAESLDRAETPSVEGQRRLSQLLLRQAEVQKETKRLHRLEDLESEERRIREEIERIQSLMD